ncbi:bifunctional cytidylyltransferase/SDR family oxidoreductase [Nonomuraea longicatena]|uniref:2-C-methyl-D-erythritol 4-phosphate cytidylyltransferase n=1 Tax=Nonomuraea longicatena TaxID=83682 RepID=A0ABN1PGS4_9ACTN
MVLAGGVGRRVGMNTPKQLVEIGGRPIIEHTIALFDAAPEIDEVIVLMTPGHTAEVEAIVARGGYGKVSRVLEGGASRLETTWRALQALGDEECDVLLHDAVRPLLEPRIITECVRALSAHRAVEVAIPSSDTVLVAVPAEGGEVVGDVPDRTRLRRAQTPQCFRLSVIRQAFERAMADPGFADRPATDDAGVVLRYLPEVPVFLVAGSERNMKVTHPIDLAIADRLLRLPAEAAGARDRSVLAGRTVAIFGAAPWGSELAELLSSYGAAVHRFAAGAPAEEALAGLGRVDHVVETAPGDLVGSAVARAAHPYLRKSGGSLLLDAAAEHDLAAATGAAVAALAEALAGEWAADGIEVACVNGGTAEAALDALLGQKG